MCCIMPHVEDVSNTRLFARLTEKGQLLVYQMQFEAKEPVAMILPIPVALPARENMVRFINLKNYPEFFAHLDQAFPVAESHGIGCAKAAEVLTAAAELPVKNVGDFIASFVPSPKDFTRLNSRFKLPQETFKKLPEYKDYGFAVFQFNAKGGTPHPMAFEFPTRLEKTLYYPTVHIHDGKIHEQERFDHTLYLQNGGYHGDGSKGNAGEFVDIARAQGIVQGDSPLRRVKMAGMLPNTDTLMDTTRMDPGRIAWTAAGIGAALLGGYLYQKRRERL